MRIDSEMSAIEEIPARTAGPVQLGAVAYVRQRVAIHDVASIAALILAVLGAAVLWFHSLNALPVFDDEAIAVWYAHVAAYPRTVNDLFGSFDYAVPPLFVWLAAFAQHLWSDRLLASRTVSVLCGLATMPALWWLAWQLYRDRIVAILAAVLFAVCPYELFFGRMALLDPLVQLLGVSIAIQSVRMFRKVESPAHQAVLLGVLLGLGQLSKGISLFFWALPVLAWYFFGPERRLHRLIRPMIPATGVAIGLYLVILASGTVRNLFRPFFTAIKYSVGAPYPGYYSTHSSISPLTTARLNFDGWLGWQQAYVGWAMLGSLILIAVVVITRPDPA
ncbi:MAG TPA: glycosyltransferase family 39 protein, partial [Chloroflexota bacterium]